MHELQNGWKFREYIAVAVATGDLMMTSVLRSLDGDLIERHPNLVAYKAALAAQLADFERREAVPA